MVLQTRGMQVELVAALVLAVVDAREALVLDLVAMMHRPGAQFNRKNLASVLA